MGPRAGPVSHEEKPGRRVGCSAGMHVTETESPVQAFSRNRALWEPVSNRPTQDVLLLGAAEDHLRATSTVGRSDANAYQHAIADGLSLHERGTRVEPLSYWQLWPLCPLGHGKFSLVSMCLSPASFQQCDNSASVRSRPLYCIDVGDKVSTQGWVAPPPSMCAG